VAKHPDAPEFVALLTDGVDDDLEARWWKLAVTVFDDHTTSIWKGEGWRIAAGLSGSRVSI
jgi:hypothetical protein